LRAFAQAVASALPEGGKRPALVAALPAEGMQSGSARFFREKMALDNLLWLGTEDVIGLGPDTEGALARYEINGQGVDLMLVTFSNAQQAQAALSGLRDAGIEGLLVADVMDDTLAAVIGQVDEERARELIDRALGALR
jgi:uroporphyrinogen-III synthase